MLKTKKEVERNFDNIIIRQSMKTGGGSGKEKESVKSESFRVHAASMTEVTEVKNKNPCRFYMRTGGICRYGDKCMFSHSIITGGRFNSKSKRDRDDRDNRSVSCGDRSYRERDNARRYRDRNRRDQDRERDCGLLHTD